MCVLAPVAFLLVLISLVNMVCEVDLPSVSLYFSDYEVIEPQAFGFPPESVAPAFRWSVRTTKERKQARKRRPSSRCRRGRQRRRCLCASGTKLRHRQKERQNNKKRRGLARLESEGRRSTRWRSMKSSPSSAFSFQKKRFAKGWKNGHLEEIEKTLCAPSSTSRL